MQCTDKKNPRNLNDRNEHSRRYKRYKEARYFSILAEEAADISNVEQMAIVIRFVDSTSRIRESFFGFYQCNEGLSGKAVSAKILETVKGLGLT